MQQADKTKMDRIPLLKPKVASGKGPRIPDFLIVEPDEATKKIEVQKQQLLEAIKPTEESIADVRNCSAVHVPSNSNYPSGAVTRCCAGQQSAFQSFR
jgi:hypothetical protein